MVAGWQIVAASKQVQLFSKMRPEAGYLRFGRLVQGDVLQRPGAQFATRCTLSSPRQARLWSPSYPRDVLFTLVLHVVEVSKPKALAIPRHPVTQRLLLAGTARRAPVRSSSGQHAVPLPRLFVMSECWVPHTCVEGRRESALNC